MKYKIYSFEEDGKTKKYYGIDSEKGDVMDFKNDAEVIEKVREMRKTSGIDYMWKSIHSISVLDKDNKISETYEDSESHWNAIVEKRKNDKWYVKMWDGLCRLKYNIGDKWQHVKYAFERMFLGYDRTVAWDIDMAMMDLIKHNVPIMVKNIHGCPQSYVEKADKLVENYEHDNDFTDRVSFNIAMGLWKSDLENLVTRCKLVTYYTNHGCQEVDDEDWVDPTQFKIPHKEFSKEINYAELSKLEEENRTKIFDFLKEHLNELWD